MSSADNKTTYYDAGVAKEEPDIQVQATATPLDTGNVQPSHIEGSSRYFCSKCQTPYDLPRGATSWRCMTCMTFNNTVADECPCCVLS